MERLTALARPGGERVRLGRVFLLAFLGFFVLSAAWSFAMPYDGPADEFQHVVRAYGVLDGQIGARVDARVTVPQSLVPTGISDTGSCMRWKLDVSAACAGPVDAHPGDRTRLVMTGSGAANYNPLYYMIVGLPIKLWPDYRGIIGARLLTGAMSSLLFAAAVAIAVKLGRGHGPLMLGGVLLAITPVAVNMTGAVNPAGPEIAAGVALWAALIALFKEEDDSRWILAVLASAGCLLAVLRQFGIGWLVVSLAIAAYGTPRTRLRGVLHNRTTWLLGATVLAAVAFGALWILLSTQGGIPSNGLTTTVPHGPSLWVKELTHRVPYYTSGLVGLTSYGDVAVPLPLTLIWFIVVGVLLVQAARRCERRIAIQLTAIVGVGYAVLIAADLQAAMNGWWLSQGRYALPLLAGAPMLAGYSLSTNGVFAAEPQGRAVRMLAWTLLPVQGIALWITMIRFQFGFRSRHPSLINLFDQAASVNPFTGDWMPPVGAVLPVGLCLAGVAILAGVVFDGSRADTGHERLGVQAAFEATGARWAPKD